MGICTSSSKSRAVAKDAALAQAAARCGAQRLGPIRQVGALREEGKKNGAHRHPVRAVGGDRN